MLINDLELFVELTDKLLFTSPGDGIMELSKISAFKFSIASAMVLFDL